MTKNPIAHSSVIAVLAAVLFGVTTPLVKHFGQGVGSFATATLLYAGAAIGAGLPKRRAKEQALGRAQIPRIALVAFFGATLAPAALAFGLKGAGALTASLLLNLEAVFTVFLAWLFFREPVGRRVLVAATLMVAGGAVLALRVDHGVDSRALAFLALCGATLGWALDNTLTRPLSDFDPQAVVFWKGGSGAVLSLAVAFLLRDAWPQPTALFALLVCGATGYGLSLRLYLRAQRALGAARTGSLFAFGPFVGSIVAFALGDREGMEFVAIAAPLFGTAVYLHLTEAHVHHHSHAPLDHEHTHTHDDGHHLHAHEPPIVGAHSHPHHHDPLEHEHPHGSDLHHRHEHEGSPKAQPSRIPLER